MMPGETNMPVPSTTSAPFGIGTLVPIAAIFPARSTIVPFWIAPRVAVSIVAPLIATTSGARVCADGRETTDAIVSDDSRNTMAAKRRVVMAPRRSGGRTLLLIVAGLRARWEHVLVEPFEVVVHRRAVALRLRRPVADAAKAVVNDQLRRYVVVEQTAIELERVRQRHTLIGGAVLNERRRLRLLDVGNRRRLRVHLRIRPRRAFQILAGERRDVGVHVIGGPVGDAGADRDRLEARRVVRGEERRDVAALAPAHGADLRRIDQAFPD